MSTVILLGLIVAYHALEVQVTKSTLETLPLKDLRRKLSQLISVFLMQWINKAISQQFINKRALKFY